MEDYDEVDFSSEEDEWECPDWDIEGSSNQEKTIELSNGKKLKAYRLAREGLSKEELSIVEKNVLSLIENNLRDKIKKYKKEGYPDEDYPEEDVTSSMTVMDRISLLEKRMNSLLSWLKSRKYGSPYQGYPHEEKKLSLRDSVIEKLSKEPFWENASPEFREKVTKEEMLRIALGTRGQENLTIEKSLVREHEVVSLVDNGFKNKIDPVDNVELDPLISWTEYLEYMGRVHTDLMDKYCFIVSSLFPERTSKYSGSHKQPMKLPEPTPLPEFHREDFKPFIKDYNKQMKLSKEELSALEDLHKEFPNLSPSELDRIRLLRRSK